MSLLVLPGVFRPRSDTLLLRDRLLAERVEGAAVLELCTGPGAIAVAAAEAGARVTAVDVSRRALRCTRVNAWRRGVPVEVLRGDLYEPVAGRRFDVVVANPPYVPCAGVASPRGASRAWAAGPDGRSILDRLIVGLPRHLAPGGRVLLVHSTLVDEHRTVAALIAAGLTAEVVDRVEGEVGPLMAEQVRARRVVAPDGREEVVVIRAVDPRPADPSDGHGPG